MSFRHPSGPNTCPFTWRILTLQLIVDSEFIHCTGRLKLITGILYRRGLISERSKSLFIIEISNDKFVCVLELTSFSSLFNDSNHSSHSIITYSILVQFCKHGQCKCPKIPGQVGMLIFLKYLSSKSSVSEVGQFNALWSKLTHPWSYSQVSS